MGFFNARDFKINNPAALGTGCGKCRLHRTCKSPKMEPYGRGEAGLMFIGDAPGIEEDEDNMPLTGRANATLDACIRKHGLDPEYDVIKLNAVACSPPDIHPTGTAIENCRGRVWSAIEKYKPKVIVPIGMAAMESLIGHRWPQKKEDKETGLGSAARWFNWSIPDRQTKCWIIPNWHPEHILDQKKWGGAAEIWFNEGMRNAVDHLSTPFPQFKDEESCVSICTDDDECACCLEEIKAGHNFIVVDYETSGLKPYREGQRIWYIGIAYSPDHALVFPTQGMRKSVQAFRRIMTNPKIRKCAHNMTYEDSWTRERLGVQVEGWVLDTIQSAHILDQRPGIAGLKFQTYVHSGLIDYSSHISEYLTTPLNEKEAEMGANGFNRISLAPPKQTMIYCGVDCIGTYRLALEHDRQLNLNIF